MRLTTLTVAALLSGGEIKSENNIPQSLLFYIHPNKLNYLDYYIKNKNIKPYVKIDYEKYFASISINDTNSTILQQWIENKVEILNTKFITRDTLYLLIILFGKRKLEGITINSGLQVEENKIISYFINQYMDVTSIPTKNEVKITNVPNFVLNSLKYNTKLSDSIELANYLLESEKNRIVKVINNLEKERVYEYI